MDKVSVRYIVADVDAAIPFYTELLGFQVDMHPAPGFASLSKGNLQLLLNQPGVGGADRRCPTARCLPPAAGIESKSRLWTYQSPSRSCGVQDAGSATRS
jgi:catechol 2,3-dioxygenase-like lactoylglutathione lyase family enzyme